MTILSCILRVLQEATQAVVLQHRGRFGAKVLGLSGRGKARNCSGGKPLPGPIFVGCVSPIPLTLPLASRMGLASTGFYERALPETGSGQPAWACQEGHRQSSIHAP